MVNVWTSVGKRKRERDMDAWREGREREGRMWGRYRGEKNGSYLSQEKEVCTTMD